MKLTPLPEITETFRHPPTSLEDLCYDIALAGRVGGIGVTLLFGLDSQINLGVLESLKIYDGTTAPKEVMDFAAAAAAVGMSVLFASFSYAIGNQSVKNALKKVDETLKHYYHR